MSSIFGGKDSLILLPKGIAIEPSKPVSPPTPLIFLPLEADARKAVMDQMSQILQGIKQECVPD